MTSGAPYKHLIRFTLPVFVGMLLQQLYNTVDSIIVGRFCGETSLSATGTCGTVIFMCIAMAIGFGAGNGVVVAQHYGAKDEKQVRANASTGIVLLISMGLAVSVISLAASRPLYKNLLSVPEEILGLTLSYFRWYAVGFVFHYGYNVIAAILRAIGDSAATMYFLLISSVANVVLDLLFVAVFHWGVAGAAIATNLSQVGCCVAAYFYMTKKYPVFRFKLREFTFSPKLASVTLKVGLPMTLQQLVVSMGLTLIQRVVNSFGTTMVASATVGQRIEMYMNLPCNSFQMTLATYCGQNVGAGRMDRVKTGAKQGVLICVGVTLVTSLAIILLRDPIIRLFSLSPEAMVYCRQHLMGISVCNFILSIYVPLFGLYQGTKHGEYPTFVAICALTTRVTVTYLLSRSAFFGYSIIWWNGLFGFGLGLTICWCIYFSGIWMKNASVITKEQENAA